MDCGLVAQVTGIQKGRGALAPLPFTQKKFFRAYGAESFFFVLFANAFRLHPQP
jgi:hypothetical protein